MAAEGSNSNTRMAASDSAGRSSSNSSSSSVQQGRHPFFSLPAELILDIVDLLPPEAFINFAFAHYPLLYSHGLAPALSRPRIKYITNRTQLPGLFPLLRVPAEITLHIMHHLNPSDMMRFVVANYQDLARQGIAPPLEAETIRGLEKAVKGKLEPNKERGGPG
jgi:hypothetical protein